MSTTEMTKDEQDFDAAFNEAASETPAKADKPKQEPKPEPKQSSVEDAGAEGEQQGRQEPAKEDTVESLRQQLAAVTRERDLAAHQARADAGRQSSITRENNQLKAEVAALKTQVEQLKAASKKPAATADGDGDLLDNAPELKAAVESRVQQALEAATASLREELDAAKSKLAEVSQTADAAAQRVAPLLSREEQQQAEDVKNQLDQRFPGWRETIKTKEFHDWLRQQDEDTQRDYFEAKTFARASKVMRLFQADEGAKKPPEGEKTPQGEGAANTLQRSAGIAPRTVTRLSPDKNDFDGAFAEFAAGKRR
jgi:chromosome segregation ATPase